MISVMSMSLPASEKGPITPPKIENSVSALAFDGFKINPVPLMPDLGNLQFIQIFFVFSIILPITRGDIVIKESDLANRSLR